MKYYLCTTTMVLVLFMSGVHAWRLMQMHSTVDPRLLPSRNQFKCHVEVVFTAYMKQYIG